MKSLDKELISQNIRWERNSRSSTLWCKSFCICVKLTFFLIRVLNWFHEIFHQWSTIIEMRNFSLLPNSHTVWKSTVTGIGDFFYWKMNIFTKEVTKELISRNFSQFSGLLIYYIKYQKLIQKSESDLHLHTQKIS